MLRSQVPKDNKKNSVLANKPTQQLYSRGVSRWRVCGLVLLMTGDRWQVTGCSFLGCKFVFICLKIFGLTWRKSLHFRSFIMIFTFKQKDLNNVSCTNLAPYMKNWVLILSQECTTVLKTGSINKWDQTNLFYFRITALFCGVQLFSAVILYTALQTYVILEFC